MENTILINRLESIKRDYTADNIDQLIFELKNEILRSSGSYKDKGKAAQTKAALNLLKKLSKKPRKVLSYASIQNGYQYLTDSYHAFKLKEFLELPSAEAAGFTYPAMERLFPKKENAMQKIDDFDFNLYLNKLKIKEKIGNYNNNEINEYFDLNFIKNVYNILGTLKLEVYYFGRLKPLLFIDPATGNEAVVLPVYN